MRPPLTLLPAVDVSAGRAVQVVGDGTDDPYAVAAGWVDQGARWVHLVDLDRAYHRGTDITLLAELVARLPVPVQLSGGIEDDTSLQAALATGAARINLSSVALRDLPWVRHAVRRHGERLAVGVDVLGAEVVARGSGIRVGPLPEVLTALHEIGPSTVVVADAARDGRRHGVDEAMFRRVAEAVEADVIASGGIASLADLGRLTALHEVGLAGAVLGSALYHGAFTLTEALDLAQEHRPRTTSPVADPREPGYPEGAGS